MEKSFESWRPHSRGPLMAWTSALTELTSSLVREREKTHTSHVAYFYKRSNNITVNYFSYNHKSVHHICSSCLLNFILMFWVNKHSYLFLSHPGGDDKLVKVWHYANGDVTHVGIGHSGSISSVRLCPNRKFIITTSADGAVLRWRFPHSTTTTPTNT